MSAGKELLNRLLSSEIKGDLLVLFHSNPGLVDTMDGVARRIGKTANTVESDVRDLVDLGVLKTKQVGRFDVISLNTARDRAIRDVVANHIKSLTTGKGV